MIVRDVQRIIERWAPKEIAWERDNVGLQVGSENASVRSILICLDVNEDTIEEALRRRANFIISHHPLLFRPLRSVDLHDSTGRCVSKLLKSKISLYSAHTNLDFTRGGTSFALADWLTLTRVDFLLKSYRLKRKIVTFVPPDHVDGVAEAMGKAGAGTIGNYESCSYRSQGTGTFRGNTEARPTIGKRGQLEHVQEVRLEMIVDQPNVQPVVRAMLSAHPYEEVAYDVYPLENISPDYGMGVIGDLRKPMTVLQFIRHVKKTLGATAVRYTPGASNRVRRVAACGGSGSDLTDEAIRQGADSFITADVKYHSFHDAARRILLIDAGHYETERPVVDALAKKLSTEFKRIGMKIPVYAALTSTNPIVSH